MQIEPITATIGAELVGINLRDAAQDDGLVREIYRALLKGRVQGLCFALCPVPKRRRRYVVGQYGPGIRKTARIRKSRESARR